MISYQAFSNIKKNKIELHKLIENFSIIIIIIFSIIYSVLTLKQFSKYLYLIEFFSFIFILEFILRIYTAKSKKKYLFSFFGIIDISSVLSLFFPNLLFLRIFRILKLLRITNKNRSLLVLMLAIRDCRNSLIAHILFSSVIIYISAFIIYIFEHQAQPEVFNSIPHSLWWAVVSLTTVGYGDMYPITIAGKIFTTFLLIMGIAVIAIPSALIAASLIETHNRLEKNKNRTNKLH